MKIKSFLYSKKVAPYVFVVPFILSLLVFWAYPLFSTIQMSFQSILPGQIEWVGLANYQRLLRDTVFHTAISNSLRYMFWTLVLLIPFPMIFAAMVDSRLVKASGFWKALMYLPALTSVVISGTLFRLLFAEMPTGQMNILMQWLGQAPVAWLKDDTLALMALLSLACWRWTGVNMLYFMAGMKNIDHDLYEAADIDGATGLQKFLRITVPLLKPTTVYVLTISVYAGLAMFLESFMLWGGNNSPMNIGLTIVGYLYRRGIERNEFGYASAVGLVLLVIALIINITQLIINGSFKKEGK
ncbi:MAG: sugar ABC transporter permease [Defluviitaleaceae bacterium]|nr:sugar ABC transporter permease [Defluviitaleaceae bacterium]MCL2836876.1 sugar ABC transporter permease [Defluviitaleaceae bacterium]